MSRNMKSGIFIAVDSCRGVPNLARFVSVTAKVFQNLMLVRGVAFEGEEGQGGKYENQGSDRYFLHGCCRGAYC